jgi:ribose 5-phosphate isomerase A
MTAETAPSGIDPAKDAAGRAAAALIENGMLLGLGTGSTVDRFLVALAARDLRVAGVPTSEQTLRRCAELGIETVDPAAVTALDIAVDGADELTADLVLTKGGGGALLREKVVAAMAERFVVIATGDKLVTRLGDSFAVPIEVVPFALGPVQRTLIAEGLEVTERRSADGASYRTDNGNAILDARLDEGLEDPEQFDVWVTLLPGVVTSGLFVDMATQALLGRADGSVETLSRPRGH